MTMSSDGHELRWLDIEALVAEIDELSKQYKMIQSRLALSRQILAAFREYTASTNLETVEPQQLYASTRKHPNIVAQVSADVKSGSLSLHREGSPDKSNHNDAKQALTSSTSPNQSRGDLFVKVLREHPEQPQHYRDVFEMMKSFDPSIEWKNPAANLRTIVYLMRKHGDERIASLGNGYYAVAQPGQNEQKSKKHE